MLGTRTWGDSMEGADESTELWQHPSKSIFTSNILGHRFPTRLCRAHEGDLRFRHHQGLSQDPQDPHQLPSWRSVQMRLNG